MVKIALIDRHDDIIGESQGFLGLPIRVGVTYDEGTQASYRTITTAWEFSMEELLKMMNGQKLHIRLLAQQHPPIMCFVGDPEPTPLDPPITPKHAV